MSSTCSHLVQPVGRVLLLFILAWYGLSTPAEAGLREQVMETTLPNGLKVILLEKHTAPLVTLQVWYRVGSRNEAWGKTGLSHMLEHMMFKGTEQVGAEAFSRIIQQHGGNTNAFTAQDFTAYFENLSADQVPLAVDLEADRMHNLVLRESDFDTERLVVMEERRLRTEDNPSALLMEQVEATAFQTSPYHWPTIGWMADLSRLTLADVQAHYQTYYHPSNAFLVVVGDFTSETLLPKITQAFGAIPAGALPHQIQPSDPPQRGERRVIVEKEAQLPLLLMAYQVPNLRDQDGYVLEVIAALLAQGKSSRLYQSLVQEQQLALDTDADNPLLSRDPALFTLSVTPLPGKDVDTVEQALDREIIRLQRDSVAEHELHKAKNQLEAAFVMQQDAVFSQAMLLAQYEIVDSWRTMDAYVAAIRAVSAVDIQRVATQYLTPNRRTVGVLVPLPDNTPHQASTGPANGPIR